MIAKQKQSLESFVRVLAFVEAHPLPGPLTYAGAAATLADVIRRLREHAGTQLAGRDLSRTEVGRQRQLVQQLLDRHMRPIVAIARSHGMEGAGTAAAAGDHATAPLPSGLRMPRSSMGVTKVLQACDGVIEAVRPSEAAFVSAGLPADFLARFTAARDELERLLGGRAAFVGSHVAARAGLQVQIRRGRAVVNRVDAAVRATFDGDEVTLAAWAAAKRVHLVPGGAGARGSGEELRAA